MYNESVANFEKYRIQSTLFVPPGLIGLPANHVKLLKQNCYPDEAMMNLEDLKLWKQEGQQIGFHTYNHINLKCLTQEDIEYDFHMGLESCKNGECKQRFCLSFWIFTR